MRKSYLQLNLPASSEGMIRLLFPGTYAFVLMFVSTIVNSADPLYSFKNKNFDRAHPNKDYSFDQAHKCSLLKLIEIKNFEKLFYSCAFELFCLIEIAQDFKNTLRLQKL